MKLSDRFLAFDDSGGLYPDFGQLSTITGYPLSGTSCMHVYGFLVQHLALLGGGVDTCLLLAVEPPPFRLRKRRPAKGRCSLLFNDFIDFE